MDYLDLEKNKKAFDHFWYKARNDLIFKIFSQNKIKDIKILELGCGVGSQMNVLYKFSSQVSGMDISPAAVLEAQNRGLAVFQGDIEQMTEVGEKYDLICIFDVLEHLEKDSLALENIYKMLKDDGTLMFSVPVGRKLFSNHDIYMQHKRRYSHFEIKQKVSTAGFEFKDIFYWNSILFPFAAIKRILFKSAKPRSDFKNINKLINSILFQILKLENNLIIRKIRFPFGLSIFGVAYKK